MYFKYCGLRVPTSVSFYLSELFDTFSIIDPKKNNPLAEKALEGTKAESLSSLELVQNIILNESQTGLLLCCEYQHIQEECAF